MWPCWCLGLAAWAADVMWCNHRSEGRRLESTPTSEIQTHRGGSEAEGRDGEREREFMPWKSHSWVWPDFATFWNILCSRYFNYLNLQLYRQAMLGSTVHMHVSMISHWLPVVECLVTVRDMHTEHGHQSSHEDPTKGHRLRWRPYSTRDGSICAWGHLEHDSMYHEAS